MTPQERAEKIAYDVIEAICHVVDRNIYSEDILRAIAPEIAAQLAEAEREAYSKAVHDMDRKADEIRAEGFRAGQEEYKVLHPGAARDLVSYQAGFNAAREKAKGLIDNLLTHHNHRFDGGLTICSAPEFSGDCIVQRIGEMEP